MAVKQDAENIRDRADRIVRIILFAQRNTVDVEGNPDLTLSITPAIKQALQAKVQSLQDEIKTIAAGW